MKTKRLGSETLKNSCIHTKWQHLLGCVELKIGAFFKRTDGVLNIWCGPFGTYSQRRIFLFDPERATKTTCHKKNWCKFLHGSWWQYRAHAGASTAYGKCFLTECQGAGRVMCLAVSFSGLGHVATFLIECKLLCLPVYLYL